jgi:FlaA1/EpsC-like NDP-sugar epimerase
MIRLSGLEVGRDVEIVFTGLRPGEKLFEELHYANAKYLPTRHPKIMVLCGARQDPKELHATVDRLLNLGDNNPWRIVEHLRGLVPEYKPGITSPYAAENPSITGETAKETTENIPSPSGGGPG